MRGPVLNAALVLVVGACAIPVVWLSCNGVGDVKWLRSEEQIKASLSTALATGSSRKNVEAYLAARSERLISSSTRAGFVNRQGIAVGSGHMAVVLGSYRVMWRHEVSVWVAFDASENVVSVEVRKEADAL